MRQLYEFNRQQTVFSSSKLYCFSMMIAARHNHNNHEKSRQNTLHCFFCQQHSFLKLCEYRNIHHFLGQKLTIFFEEWGCYIGNQKCDMDAIALAAIRSSTTGILERTEDSMV